MPITGQVILITVYQRSFKDLESRLQDRKQDSSEIIQARMADFELAVNELESIFVCEYSQYIV